MKRASYVDKSGNTIDHAFESKKSFLNLFFVIGTIVPLIVLGLIIYTMIDNSTCNKVYDSIKSATLEYIKDNEKMPDYEGDSTTINIDKLYSGEYLSSSNTNNLICSGKVKATKYKNDIVYTLDVNDCNTCSVNKRYGSWSNELSYYPTNKTIVDVIPYYNYYERQVLNTEWSKDYEEDELSKKESKYGVKLPKNKEDTGMPEVPKEGEIVEVQTLETPMYRYVDKQWRWYNEPLDYSDFSSEQPSGFSNKDEATKIYTEWSDYSLNYPGKQDYREIKESRGYKFYYEKDGKKVYANNGKYTVQEDIDESKYDKRDEETSTLYSYRDAKWRWYNGQKRMYSSYRSVQPDGYPYRDDATEQESMASSWKDTSSIDSSNSNYRKEETKILTKFRYVYEILSLPVLKKPVTQDKFEEKVAMMPSEFAGLEEYKLEVTYKFKYRKR
ncbi:MAG: hypothetical protein HFH47_03375 [Bacilli bacterium]|nr:hypothetical protein [Bacilli bacterium]